MESPVLKNSQPDSKSTAEKLYYPENTEFELDGYHILNTIYYLHNLREPNRIACIYDNEEDNSRNLRSLYVANTEELIDKITVDKIEEVIYLDKSARPVSWMVREFWPIFTNADGSDDKPGTWYANIDASEATSLDKTSSIRPTEQQLEDSLQELINNQDFLQSVRATYKDHRRPGQSVFDGKKVLIVDELTVTGLTLRLARAIFEAAFPEAEFHTYAWDRYSGMGKSLILPVWYSSEKVEGRGVGDKGEHPILSSALDDYDPLSASLRSDIKRLAQEVKDGKQPIIPMKSEYEFYYKKDEAGNVIHDANGEPVLRFLFRELPKNKKTKR